MSEWSITPTEGAHDNGNGNYTFTPPETGERKYTITYTDGDVSGSIEYVVKSTDCYVNPCKNNLTPPTVSPSTVANFSSDGGEIEATYNLDDCWELITATTTNKVVDVTLTNPSIITVTSNTSNTEQVSVVTYKFRNEIANVTGESKVTITQKFDECINKPAPTVTFTNGSTSTNVPAMGTDEERTAHVLVGTDTCWRLEYKEFISPTPQNHAIFVGDDAIKVLSNETDYNVTVKAKYHFVNISDSSKTSDSILEITQTAGCNCSSITNYQVLSTTIQPTSTTANICSFNLTSSCDINKVTFVLSDNSDGVVVVNSNSPKIISNGSNSWKVTAQTNTNETAQEKSFTYHLSYNNVSCESQGLTGRTKQGIGCNCNCSNLNKIYNEQDSKSYLYINDDLDGTHFKPLGVLSSTTSDCNASNIIASSTSSLITDITCVGINDTEHEIPKKLKDKYINRNDVFVIVGKISCTTETGAFTINYRTNCSQVSCGSFNVYHRCECGMDDCYQIFNVEGENRMFGSFLYIHTENRCSTSSYTTDTVCVNRLSAMTYYEDGRESGYTELIKGYTIHGNQLDIDFKYNGGSRIEELITDDTYKLVIPTQEIPIGRGITIKLVNDDASISPYLTHIEYESNYNNSFAKYLDEANGDYRKYVDIKFATTSHYIAGGDNNGKCAINEFYVRLFLAYPGYRYERSCGIDDKYETRYLCPLDENNNVDCNRKLIPPFNRPSDESPCNNQT